MRPVAYKRYHAPRGACLLHETHDNTLNAR
jgi:hypothetical protein